MTNKSKIYIPRLLFFYRALEHLLGLSSNLEKIIVQPFLT